MSGLGLEGIAVIIDDDINDKSSNISKLVDSLESKKIPCVKYEILPEVATMPNFSSAAFVVLDWITDPDTFGLDDESSVISEPNIEFIKELLKTCFCPVFVFTNSDTDKVSAVLTEANILQDPTSDLVYVKSKNELLDGKVFDVVQEWTSKNPVIHTLLTWENAYERAKRALFVEFYSYSKSWPKVMWDTYQDDNVSPAQELGDMITRNLQSRMSPFQFDEEVFNSNLDVPKEELRKVMAGEKFMPKQPEEIKNRVISGDVFKTQAGKYYINVRPDCDGIERGGGAIKMHLLSMKVLTEDEEKESYQQDYGNFLERSNEALVFNMLDSITFSIKFKEKKIVKWNDYEAFYIGKLLPPHITRVRQRYALYIQSEGMPRVPSGAVIEP